MCSIGKADKTKCGGIHTDLARCGDCVSGCVYFEVINGVLCCLQLNFHTGNVECCVVMYRK
jgi:hypothetical protein